MTCWSQGYSFWHVQEWHEKRQSGHFDFGVPKRWENILIQITHNGFYFIKNWNSKPVSGVAFGNDPTVNLEKKFRLNCYFSLILLNHEVDWFTFCSCSGQRELHHWRKRCICRLGAVHSVSPVIVENVHHQKQCILCLLTKPDFSTDF